MKCPHLVEWINWVILLCEAGKRPYVPTLPELRAHCKSGDYSKCPNYQGAAKIEPMAVREELHAVRN